MTAPSPRAADLDPAARPPLPEAHRPAGEALLRWAARTDPDRPRLCVVRGARGSGKSTLLAWFHTGSAAHRSTTVHASVSAAGLFAEAFAWELARRLGYGPLPPRQMLTHVTADARPLLLLVPDLHRAGRGPADLPRATARHLVDEVLRPLLALPHVRAVVEVGPGGLLDETVAEQEQPPEVIDLGDTPASPGGEAGKDGEDGEDGEDPSAAFAALLGTVPRTADGRPIWDRAPARSRERALDRALALPRAERRRAVRSLLTDPGFLLHGSPVAVAATLADERVTVPAGLPEIWRRAAPQLTDPGHDAGERAALLHAAALGTSPALSEFLRPLAEHHPWTALWARHRGPVTALVRTVDAGPTRLVAADPLGRLHCHDPATGEPTGDLPSPGDLRPQQLAAHPGGALLALDGEGGLHALPAAPEGAAAGGGSAEAVLDHLCEVHHQAASADEADRPTALGGCRDHAVVGDARGTVHLWPLAQSPAAGALSRRLHHAPLSAVTCLSPPGDGRTLVGSAGFDGCVRLWETPADPPPDPLERRPALVTALAAAPTPQGPVLAAVWSDLRVHLWHLPTGRMRAVPLLYACDTVDLAEDGRLTVGGPQGVYAVRLDLTRLWE